MLVLTIVIMQRRAREVVDYRLFKLTQEKQIEDSVHISSKLDEHNKVMKKLDYISFSSLVRLLLLGYRNFKIFICHQASLS